MRIMFFLPLVLGLTACDNFQTPQDQGVETAPEAVEPVAPATWVRPVARATSMPRWIEWIQAAHE